MSTTTTTLIIILAAVIVAAIAFYRHQSLLRERAWMMQEAIRNRDFQFRLPTRGLFFGERALQQVLNNMGQDINRLVAQSEVESWQRLTRVLTHEIMNATAPIQCISEIYLNNPGIKDTPYEEGIRAIHNTCKGLSAFVSNYRILTQLQKPVPTTFALLPLVQTVASLYPNVEWSVSIPESLSLKTDENLLRQVLINLTKNAIEAGARHVDIRHEHNSLLISNNGNPIPPDARQEIFIPFFTTKHTGSGIGLSLSRQVLMMQGMNLLLTDRPVVGYSVSFEIAPIN